MAIYSEDQDPNTVEKTAKEVVIDKINTIIAEYGSFGVYDVDAESSPIVESKGRLTHLMEEFREGDGTVRIYDPSSHSSDEIDSYDEFYEELELEQLEYILELAESWEEFMLN